MPSLTAENWPLWGFALAFVLLLGQSIQNKWARRERPAKTPLDTALMHWTADDPFTVRDLLNGGVAILGRAGSGKTSSSGKALARAIAWHRGSGGVILAAKPEDFAAWRKVFTSAGREADLIVFGPSEPLRFNFLDYARKLDNQTRGIVQCLLTIGESLQAHDPKGGGERDSFWRQQEERLLYNAVEIVQRATGRVSAPLLQQFITGAAQSREELNQPEWRAGAHCKMLEAAHAAATSEIEKADFALAMDFWAGEYPVMADKTRSSILAGVQGVLHVFNTGIVRELVSTGTTVSPDDTLAGKWVLVNMAPSEWGSAGSFVSAGWKYLAQRAVLKRTATDEGSFHVIWADEAQQFVNSFDSQYIAQCRSHHGCLVYLSQSLPGYFAALKGDAGEHQTKALLANFSHTILHAVDPVTAEWAAKKLGRCRETFFGGSSAPPEDMFDALFGQPKLTSSFSEQYENVLQENVFQNGLRTGGPANRFLCDAIVLRSGEPFACGENFLRITFPQGDS